MDLTSRWDRFVVLGFVLFGIGAMAGCQGISSGGSANGGLGSNNGSVAAATTNLDFGMVVVGSSKTLTDTITNTSAASVTISSAKASNAQYQISGLMSPLVIAPGQSASLTITFKPSTAGNPSGTIAIMTSSSSTPELDLAVSGSAVSAGTLTVTPASLPFGNIQVGQSRTQNASLMNSGGSSVVISQASASNGVFTINGLTFPLTLAPGQKTAFTVTFVPKAAGEVNGTISINGAASLVANAVSTQSSPTSAVIQVSGAGTIATGQLTVSPTILNFGNLPVHTSQRLTVTLTNIGGTSSTVTQAIATGSGFAISGLALPITLGPEQSTSFQVSFTPAAAGPATGSITISSTASNSNLSMALTGTGINPASLTATPASLNFGTVTVGSSQNQSGVITNSGGTNITVSQATASGAGFNVHGITLPLTLSPGQSTAFTATFNPTASGSVSGNIVFVSTVATVNVTLTGSGLAVGSLGASPASVNFGNVQIGTKPAQLITLTNWSSSSVTVSHASLIGAGFNVTGLALPLTLAAGQSTNFTVTFAPSSGGHVTGNLAITSSASNNLLNLVLSGTGVTVGTLGANPTTITFGSVAVGGSATRSETLTNSGGSSISISAATVAGAGFALSGLNLPTTLSAGQSLTFNVTFSPKAAGSASGTISFTASGSVPSLNLSLSGAATAPGQLTVAPATVNFGSVTVGANQHQTGTLTASGGSVTISSVASNNPEFTLTGLSLPLTLAAGQSAPFTLTFTPQASGAASGSIVFTSSGTKTSVAQSVSGSGTQALQHTVSLSWKPSSSTVAGYHVYRGTQSGGPYIVVNAGIDPNTDYVDDSVQSGRTYYYVVTAIDASGAESAYSNQVQAVIPSP